jgi:hypothetical protein
MASWGGAGLDFMPARQHKIWKAIAKICDAGSAGQLAKYHQTLALFCQPEEKREEVQQ